MEFQAWLQDNVGMCLTVLCAVTILAVLLEMISGRRRRGALRQLAVRWRMTYSPTDRLRLLARIADKLPIPGAADVNVSDVIYGSHCEHYRYVFTVRYTLGVIRGKRSIMRAAYFTESRGPRPIIPDQPTSVRLADEQLPLLEQYLSLAPEGSTDDRR
jgi:hypothetical protein